MRILLLVLALIAAKSTLAQDFPNSPTIGRVFHFPALKLDLAVAPSRLGMPIGYVVDAREEQHLNSQFQFKLNQAVHGASYASGFYPTQVDVQNADSTTAAVLIMQGYTIQPVTHLKEFHTFNVPVGKIYKESRE